MGCRGNVLFLATGKPLQMAQFGFQIEKDTVDFHKSAICVVRPPITKKDNYVFSYSCPNLLETY